MSMRKFFHLILIFLFLCDPLIAADHCIRAGATGSNNGSDWDNAWTSFPSPLIRGDTYYVADGSYAGFTSNVAPSGSTRIYIKKAIESDHGPSTGWNSSYGDGQLIFTSIVNFYNDYYTLDGQVGGGQTSYDSGHGIVFSFALGDGGKMLNGWTYDADHIQVFHCAFIPTNSPCNMTFGDATTAIYFNTTSGTIDGTEIAYCYFKDIKKMAILITPAHNALIERNYFHRGSYSDGDAHGQNIQFGLGASYNCDIRYNLFRGGAGTGYIAMLGYDTHVDTDIYGNIFWYDADNACWDLQYSEAIGNVSHNQSTGIHVVNNTFVVSGGSCTKCARLGFDNSTPANNFAYNNIYYGVSPTYLGISTANNTTFGSDPFTSIGIAISSGNFHLSEDTPEGTDTSGIDDGKFIYDMLGNPYNENGGWTRGAISFSPSESGSASPKPILKGSDNAWRFNGKKWILE